MSATGAHSVRPAIGIALVFGVSLGGALAACTGASGEGAGVPSPSIPSGCTPSVDANGVPVEEELPDDLACTGLYESFAERRVATRVRAYAPAVAFWTDGLDKDRYIDLPDGATIDATTIDDLRFPVGTKVWKEIRKGLRKIETRYFRKVREDRWVQTAYVWSPDGTTARRGEGSDIDVEGAPYHVPSSTQCNECHKGRRDRLLGFEALSLGQPGATGLTLAGLVAEGRLAPRPPKTALTVPDPALGYLHVNCGVTCHNGTATATGLDTGLRLRVAVAELDRPIGEWDLFKTTVEVPARTPRWEGEPRIAPGAAGESLLVTVMQTRGEGQMPPLASATVDTHAVDEVSRWITSLRR